MSGVRTYNPTTEELNTAIEKIIASHKSDWRDIHAQLKKDHTTWKLPERRVSKFVKRQKAGKPILDAQDEEKSIKSGGSLRSFLSSRSNKSKSSVAANTPPKEVNFTKDVEDNDTVLKSVGTEETMPEQAPPLPEELYKDDNQGKKELGCWFCTF